MQTPETVQAFAVGSDAVATLSPAMYHRKLYRVSINGPRGSRVELYLGNMSQSGRFDQSSKGESNTAEYANAQDIPLGMIAAAKWPGQAANAGVCSATFTTERV